MGVEREKGLILLFQIGDHPHQHDMLENVGKIPCVVDMAVIHGGRVSTGCERVTDNFQAA
jgi:hypothetical protein